MNVVSAAIPGTDPNAGEMLLVAHLFERIATPGANDNCSGVATILEVGRTQWGANSQFNYRLVPYISGSDHTIFLAAGIPTMQFNYYSDNFYHSSEDRSKHVDPTEMKRVGFMAASAFYYLSTADSQGAQNLAWESAANGDKWMGEVSRQSIILLQNDTKKIHAGYLAAQNKIEGAFLRGKGNLMSVTDISDDNEVTALLTQLSASLESSRNNHALRLENAYQARCRTLDVEPQDIQISEQEELSDHKVPNKLYPVYSEDYKSRTSDVNKHIPQKSPLMPGLARSEIPILIDGHRTILDIYRIVQAEHAFVNTSSDEFKYAYVITPDSPDVQLQSVIDYVTAMEKAGLVEIKEK